MWLWRATERFEREICCRKSFTEFVKALQLSETRFVFLCWFHKSVIRWFICANPSRTDVGSPLEDRSPLPVSSALNRQDLLLNLPKTPRKSQKQITFFCTEDLMNAVLFDSFSSDLFSSYYGRPVCRSVTRSTLDMRCHPPGNLYNLSMTVNNWLIEYKSIMDFLWMDLILMSKFAEINAE